MTTKKTTAKTATAPEKLPANPFLFEVLDLVSKQRSNAKKVEVLQEYKDPSLMAVLIWNYDTSLQSAIPPGDVPFAEAKEIGVVGNDTSFSDSMNKQLRTTEMLDSHGSNNRTTIRKEYTNFFNFIRGGNDTLSSIRRETMFINLLYGLHPREAEIICLVKDKRLQEKYKISFEVVKEAFPEIQWGNRV
jgi:Family of unknown function (DUF6433)